MEIQIEIQRPFLYLMFASAVGVGVMAANGVHSQQASVPEAPVEQVQALGGDKDTSEQVKVAKAERQAMRARIRQAVVERQQEVLRYQIEVLQEERRKLGKNVSMETENEFRESVRSLIALLQDQKAAEEQIVASLHELWEAEGRATEATKGGTVPESIYLAWPVEPFNGISATFSDSGYKQLFGFDHGAIDIPTPQGTRVRAADEGVVLDISDRGYGFNSITIQHSEGVATLYGHVSAFLVEEGDHVERGQAIALSGGMPGTKGAGKLTTGPHLHFEVFLNGEKVDPMEYLIPEEERGDYRQQQGTQQESTHGDQSATFFGPAGSSRDERSASSTEWVKVSPAEHEPQSAQSAYNWDYVNTQKETASKQKTGSVDASSNELGSGPLYIAPSAE